MTEDKGASIKDIVAILRTCEVFAGLDEAELGRLASLSGTAGRELEDGDAVFVEGEPADRLFVLAEGAVDLQGRVIGKGEVLMARLEPGAVFGWSTIAAVRRYTMTARARGETRLVVISGDRLLALMEELPGLGHKALLALVQVVGQRFRRIRYRMGAGDTSVLV